MNEKVLVAFVILLKCNKSVFFISGKSRRYMLKFILDFCMKNRYKNLCSIKLNDIL